MSNISADKIKKLRDKTGAGMMDCKTALIESLGDIEKSVSWLRKKGIANAEKKLSRTASQGLIGLIKEKNICTILEVNTETDFVSKNEEFQAFVSNTLNIASKKKYLLESLLVEMYDKDYSIAEALKNLIAKIGENIVIRRITYLNAETPESIFGSYIHNKISPTLGKIGSLVKIKTKFSSEKVIDLANKIAMHIAASKPIALNENLISIDNINKEKEIYSEQLKLSGKPDDIIEKILEGKIKKYLSEVTLENQNWILEPSLTVRQLIADFNKENSTNISIEDYKLFVLGEGIEVNEKKFSEEVASQITNTS